MARSFTTSEIARIYGLADSTIRHYRAEGRITPRGRTPGGHARYDLDEVIAVLGPPVRADVAPAPEPRVTGLVSERFAALGQHDLRSSGRTGVLPAEMVALGAREVDADPAAERTSAGRPRWGGKLLTPRREVHA